MAAEGSPRRVVIEFGARAGRGNYVQGVGC